MGFWDRFVKKQPAPTTAQGSSQMLKDVSPQEFQQLLQTTGADPNVVILDVRTPAEFAQGRLAKAVNIDYNASNFADELKKLDKDQTYFIYCRSGNRSGRALQVMKNLQFKTVYNMRGGIGKWQAQGLPIVK